jgi:hypothetical protein
MPKVTRQDVYAAIDSERAYQQDKWGDNPHEFDAWILYMEDYLEEARRLASRSNDIGPALAAIRKVTALGVVCMEQHGAPQRDGFERPMRTHTTGARLLDV